MALVFIYHGSYCHHINTAFFHPCISVHFWTVMVKTRRTKEQLERIKENVKSVYLHEGMTNQKELAIRFDVSQNTISSWVNEGNWSKLKKNFLLTREELMASYLDEATELQNFIKNKPEGFRFADHKEAINRRQLIKDIKELEVTACKSEVIAACIALINFTRPENVEEAKIIMKWADIYIKSLL